MPLGDAVFVSAGECGKSPDERRKAATLRDTFRLECIKRRISMIGFCHFDM
jgi:hypothetical protein